jgi:cysteine desulfurase
MTSYLDYNATSPMHDLAKQALINALDIVGNPSSSHKIGLKARMVVDDARYSMARLFNIRQEQVIFTSGGSESNNIIIKGIVANYSDKKILVSPLEHPSVHEVSEGLKNLGFAVETLKLNEDYSIDLQDLESKLKTDEYGLVSLSFINSETGIIQNVKQVAELCRQYNCLVHTDATQAWGKVDVDFNDLRVNLMTLSAHKIGLAKGVGLIITDGKADLPALIHGGGQERGRRAGTENVQALATLSIADQVLDDIKKSHEQVKQLRDYLESEVKALNHEVIIVGENANRAYNTSYLITPNIDAQTQVINADMNDVCISAGSACSSGKVKASSVINALGFSDELANCGIRVSLGKETTKMDIDRFLQAYRQLMERKK